MSARLDGGMPAHIDATQIPSFALSPPPRPNAYANPILSRKWALQNSMEEQWEMQQKTGLGTEKDADLMRETLLETSPWLLALTFLVSVLHMVFDFLVFKNEVQFWRQQRSLEGAHLVPCLFPMCSLSCPLSVT